ncbi:MAG: glycosyltransferase [Clostridia bacterium]|nr:glycosyltransferase [Clostridia bacterium]MBR2602152.1 glycosyltransferase [Clostridia bacterium]MBR7173725.1 glycosyltransferase [Clostridia bacterium]
MKILLASDSFIYQTSGVANVVIALAEGLRQRGNEVKVLALSNDMHSRREGDNYFIRSAKSVFYPDVRINLVHHNGLLTELKEWQPDIIHLHTEGSVARMTYHLADETGAPLVMTTHTDYAHFIFGRYRSRRPVQKLMTEWGNLVYKRAARVIAPSEKAKRFIQLKSVRDRIVVIPNGIPLSHYQKPVAAEEKAELFRKAGLEDSGNTLVMVTRLSKEKNIAEILKYMPGLLERNPRAQLILVGDGPDRERLEEMTRQEGLEAHVRFMGRIPPEEVYRFYAMGDVFVSASTFEVHSLSYLEAMACGLPLVCREDDCLLGVLADGENGRIYRTEGEYLDAVTEILQDPELRGRMRQNALKRIQDFSEERFVDNTYALYREVLNGQ